MSYTLQIWESPFPTNVHEADAICDQLLEEEESGKKGPQNPKFIALAKQLTQRYPCITQLTGDEPDGYKGGVWSEGPLNGITKAPIYGIGIATSFLQEVVPFVQKTANALGLIAYDPQTNNTYLPSGKVLVVELPPINPALQEAVIDADAIEDDAHFERVAIECLKPTLIKHGFKVGRKKYKFYRQHDGFYFEIGLGVHLYNLALWTMLHVTERLDLIEDKVLGYQRDEKKTIVVPIQLEKMGDYFQTNRTPYPKLRHIMGIRKVSEIKNTLNQITIYLEKSYFPVINKIINLEKIYAHIQTQDGDNPFALIGESRTIQLLLAYIVKVKDLEAVIDDIRSDLSTLPPVCTEWFENTLELIKLDQLKNG